MTRLKQPLLVFDGDCGFCRAWIARWRRATGDAVDYAPWQRVAEQYPDIAPERFRESVILIEPEGRVSIAAEAVFRALARAPRRGFALACYRRLPGFRAVSEFVYRQVANHRAAFTVLTRVLWGGHVVPPGERLTAWAFLRLLALVYFAAFASLGVQITGLVGRDGLLPLGPYLEAALAQIGSRALWVLPTLGWWNHGDAFLSAQCWLGCAAALLLAIGIAPAAMLILMWVLYLSLTTAGQEFLWFQWDSLLLEAGFLAIFLAPLGLRSTPRLDPPPLRGAVWMLRWLLFRLMFGSALVKWSSGDPEWRRLTALTHHYETQPLPPWTAWYAHHLPVWAQAGSAAVMFVIEGAVPFLIFAPRRARMFAAGALATLQTSIFITGNYGFFNLLSLALCALLLDDAAWPAALRRWARVEAPVPSPSESAPPRRGRWPRALTRPVFAALAVLSLVPLVRSIRQPTPWLEPLSAIYREVSPFHLVNPYGLFAVMTTRRFEITVEGSRDGVTWRPYEFRWKPGDARRIPAFTTPHMPRLDWQMWFAALDPEHVPPWFAGLCARLLLGSRPVLVLLATNPFPDAPPRYVRATLEDYRFTTAAERRAGGAWWVRTTVGTYVPAIALEDDRLVPAPPQP